MEAKQNKIEDKVYVLENILFDRDDKGRMHIFDSVFNAIKDVDESRTY